MRIASKLAFLLALAALAVAAAPAFATDSSGTGFATAGAFPNTTASTSTTVTPPGDWSGTETAPGTLETDSGLIISCQSSDFAATVIENGTASTAFTFDTLTFNSCAETTQALTCTVAFTPLPDLRLDFDTPRSNMQATSGAITIICALGLVRCGASIDTTTGTIGNTESDGTIMFDGADNVTFGPGTSCGGTASWTQSWDIGNPATYTITACCLDWGGDVRPRGQGPTGGELTRNSRCRPFGPDWLSLCRSSPVGDVPA